MYPLCCIDIRNFLNQIYLFSDDHFQNSSVIDETLKNVSYPVNVFSQSGLTPPKSLDELLCQKVSRSLVGRLSSQYPGQIVQILTNLDHFETACRELQELLVEARSSSSAAGPIVLKATEEFANAKKAAEKRIFELVNSKIDDLIETAEYDWYVPSLSHVPCLPPHITQQQQLTLTYRNSTFVPQGASPYMQELTRYLSNIMSSVFLGLPVQIKELIYFDALSHISTSLLALPLDASIRRIAPQSVHAFRLDVDYLVDFVESLDSTVLMEGLDELRQTVDLMATAAESGGKAEEEFFDVERGRRRFGKVDKMNGAELIEKVSQGREAADKERQAQAQAQISSPVERTGKMGFSNLANRFGVNKDRS